LVTNQAENVQRGTDLPPDDGQRRQAWLVSGMIGSLFGLFHPQPSERNTPSQHGERSRNVRTPNSIVCKGPDDEEDDRLYGERKTVGDQDNRVDCIQPGSLDCTYQISPNQRLLDYNLVVSLRNL
jgi:hypothetical protein